MSERKRLSRLEPEVRREQILASAVSLARRKGYSKITRDGIAEAAKCSTGLVTSRFGTMTALRRDIMREAIRLEILEILAQGLASRDRHAMKAPQELKDKAVALLAL